MSPISVFPVRKTVTFLTPVSHVNRSVKALQSQPHTEPSLRLCHLCCVALTVVSMEVFPSLLPWLLTML